MTFTTPDLCDTHPQDVQVLALPWHSYGGRQVFGGPVSTVRCYEDNSRVKEAASEPGKGRVLVVDGAASLRRALLGDMIAEAAAENGWAGMVICGAVRDVDELGVCALGVQALGSIPLRTERRGLGERDVDIVLAGVTISPGNFIYADNTGVVVARKALV